MPVPTGTAPVTLSAATPAATFAALAPTVPAVAVSIASPPKVTFSLTDAAGNPIIGFGSTAKSATATVASYPNLAFALAKYVPGTPVATTTTATPGKWVSYIVTTVPTTTTAKTATRPSTDSTGTLVDNKNGTYTSTVYRDITKATDEVAALTLTGANVAADLGDLTYDPNALHRLTIQIAGNAPGTGTNTPDAVQVTAGVPMTNPINVIYDFIPATGKAVAPTDATINQRLIVDKASCNECHGKLGGIPGTESATFHGGSRYDPKYCVVCHTDQRKYGQARAVSTSNEFPALTKTVNATTGAVSYSPFTYVADGVTIGDFPVLIHRIHKGEELIKKNYNFANVLLNETKFPQDIRNCTKCHDGTAPKVAPQASNFKMVPSRLACGACHDGIDFATGKGTRNDGTNGGHVGGAKADDSQCALCHDAATIPTYHIPVTPPNAGNALLVSGGNANTNSAWIASNTSNLPTGAIKVTYDISSVSRNASKQPVMVFKMLQNGTAVAFNTYDATKSAATQEIWNNFLGSPSAYFVFSVPQDGITAPSDFNVSMSGYIRNVWNGKATGTGAGTLAGPDASGYYTITLTGVQVPDSAVMLTGGLGYTYGVISTPPLTQTNLADYPVAASTATGLNANNPNKTGGLIVVTPDVQKVATGYTGRRVIVEDARCNKCHYELGMFTAEAFHAGQRNAGSTCAWCHRPNQTSSGWSADSTSFVHAIHAADKRDKPFTWHAATTTASFADIGYPGILSNCETCHAPGTYDFSAAASSAALPYKLYRTVGQGRYAGTAGATYQTYSGATCATLGTSSAQTAVGVFSLSPYITADNTGTTGTNYGVGFSFNAGLTTSTGCKPDGTAYSVAAGGTLAADGSTLVISPIATACFSCHDKSVAQQHMESNGASIYRDRTTALAKSEQCMFCHQPTSAFGLGIAAVHKK